MEALAVLGASALAEVMTSYRDAVGAHQETINRLNVYPVPDGDTGTNMALTVQSIVAEIDELHGPRTDMAAVCKAINHGSLMGARGNSGVILSQLLRGGPQPDTARADARWRRRRADRWRRHWRPPPLPPARRCCGPSKAPS